MDAVMGLKISGVRGVGGFAGKDYRPPCKIYRCPDVWVTVRHHMTTIFAAMTDQTRRQGDHPAVVFHDADSGERTELSFATLHNWVSKTANLLLDSFDAGLGSDVRLDVPLHWLVPVVALGTWATGATLRMEPGGDVVVMHEDDLTDTDARPDLVIGTAMGGRPQVSDVGGALIVTDILAQPDEFVDDPGEEGAWALGGRTQATLLNERRNDDQSARVLHAAQRTGDDLFFLLARTLPHGTGVVLARGFDDSGLRRLADQENAD